MLEKYKLNDIIESIMQYRIEPRCLEDKNFRITVAYYIAGIPNVQGVIGGEVIFAGVAEYNPFTKELRSCDGDTYSLEDKCVMWHFNGYDEIAFYQGAEDDE